MRTLIVILLWCILFTLSAPIAIGLFFILAIFWLILLPFKIVGFTLKAVFQIVWGILTLPFRVIKG